MKKILLAMTVGLSLMLASPMQAGAQQQDTDPDVMALEGIEKLMEALGAFLKSIPQYEAPYINENGDIIIRRKNPKTPGHKDPHLEDTSA